VVRTRPEDTFLGPLFLPPKNEGRRAKKSRLVEAVDDVESWSAMAPGSGETATERRQDGAVCCPAEVDPGFTQGSSLSVPATAATDGRQGMLPASRGSGERRGGTRTGDEGEATGEG
jgi:hypothetical protein